MECGAPFQYTAGPKDARIVLVGEAWGESEDRFKKPFCGYSGRELQRLLFQTFPDVDPGRAAFMANCGDTLWLEERERWLAAAGIMLTNVFAKRPSNNDLSAWCGQRADVGKDYPFPPLSMGKYIRPEHLPELQRLRAELAAVNPVLTVLLGNTASWACLTYTKISQIRGTTAESTLNPGQKCLPTYHPAAVMRNWSLRPIVRADLLKAAEECKFREIRRPERYITWAPTLEECEAFYNSARTAPEMSIDTETVPSFGLMKTISFSITPSRAFVIPFIDESKPGWNFWSSAEREAAAHRWVELLCHTPAAKVFHNGIYDLTYLLSIGIKPKNCLHDTMLRHHSKYPEMQKSLGFLGSLYTTESSWKLMRTSKDSDALKADE